MEGKEGRKEGKGLHSEKQKRSIGRWLFFPPLHTVPSRLLFDAFLIPFSLSFFYI